MMQPPQTHNIQELAHKRMLALEKRSRRRQLKTSDNIVQTYGSNVYIGLSSKKKLRELFARVHLPVGVGSIRVLAQNHQNLEKVDD